jgi:hypothetical protein
MGVVIMFWGETGVDISWRAQILPLIDLSLLLFSAGKKLSEFKKLKTLFYQGTKVNLSNQTPPTISTPAKKKPDSHL